MSFFIFPKAPYGGMGPQASVLRGHLEKKILYLVVICFPCANLFSLLVIFTCFSCRTYQYIIIKDGILRFNSFNITF